MNNDIGALADHINCLGSGMVKDELVQDVLKELEKYSDVFYEGISSKGVTVIEKAH